MTRMLRVFGLATALVALLAACTSSGSGFGQLQVASVGQLDANGVLTVSGSHFFEYQNGAGMQVEVCGLTLPAELVGSVLTEVLLPPAGLTSVLVSDELRVTLPGDLPVGSSDVRVIRPDGQAILLESAVVCAEQDAPPVATVASLSADPTSGHAPLLVAFDASASQGEGELAYAWNFGNGNEAATADPTFRYDTPGEYIVTLTVTSETGSDTATQTISVTQQPVVTGITLEVDTAPLLLGTSTQATATVTVLGGADDSVTWSTSDETVLTVSVSGLVTAVGIGAADVIATSTFDPSHEARATVSTFDSVFAGSTVLYVADSSDVNTFALYTLQALSDQYGLTVTTTSAAQLAEALAAEPDLVFYHPRSSGFTTATADTLVAWVATGGRLIYGNWSHTTPGSAALNTALGVTFNESRNHSSFTILDEQLVTGLTSSTLQVLNGGWGVYATGYTAHAGTQVLAEFNDGSAALVLGNNGRTAVFGVLQDSFDRNNVNQFFENLFERVLMSPRSMPVPQ